MYYLCMQISLITPTVSLPRVLNKDYACQSFRCGCLLVWVSVGVCVCVCACVRVLGRDLPLSRQQESERAIDGVDIVRRLFVVVCSIFTV